MNLVAIREVLSVNRKVVTTCYKIERTDKHSIPVRRIRIVRKTGQIGQKTPKKFRWMESKPKKPCYLSTTCCLLIAKPDIFFTNNPSSHKKKLIERHWSVRCSQVFFFWLNYLWRNTTSSGGNIKQGNNSFGCADISTFVALLLLLSLLFRWVVSANIVQNVQKKNNMYGLLVYTFNLLLFALDIRHKRNESGY